MTVARFGKAGDEEIGPDTWKEWMRLTGILWRSEKMQTAMRKALDMSPVYLPDPPLSASPEVKPTGEGPRVFCGVHMGLEKGTCAAFWPCARHPPSTKEGAPRPAEEACPECAGDPNIDGMPGYACAACKGSGRKGDGRG